ncbi:MAG: triose-phosphate isomerase [Brumimicrobium sp.]|nr:triose-phosphate isomerase [Brumimicrobium sp.]
MRKKIVAGNWKMNLSREEANTLHEQISQQLSNEKSACEIYHFSPAIYLTDLIKNKKNVHVGAQNGYPVDEGAFTGEISMKQLKSIGVDAVLIGHSERRQLFSEGSEFLRQKVDNALKNGLKIFLCCGESLIQREGGKHEETVIEQLQNEIFHLSIGEVKNVVIAYEPVWAIGTGKTASAFEANQMHKAIRKAIADNYSDDVAESISIIYGGSCKPENSGELFAEPDIDGGLIGGASLKADDFLRIIKSCN